MSRKHIGNMDDLDIAEALLAFVRNATGEDVSVEFSLGVATLSGTVRTATAYRAVEDLVASHDGVMSVVNNIAVVSPLLAPQRERGQPA